jgi:hypothetical protein
MFRVRTRTAVYNYLKTKLWRSLRQISGEGKIIYWLSISGTINKNFFHNFILLHSYNKRDVLFRIFVVVEIMNRM